MIIKIEFSFEDIEEAKSFFEKLQELPNIKDNEIVSWLELQVALGKLKRGQANFLHRKLNHYKWKSLKEFKIYVLADKFSFGKILRDTLIPLLMDIDI